MHIRVFPAWLFAQMVFCMLCLALFGVARAEEEPPPPEQAPAIQPAPAPPPAHIALILPTKARAFAMPADEVRQGALAAEQRLGDERTPKLQLYATGDSDDEVVAAYKQAISQGAVGVIGPMTRSAIAKLAQFGQLEVPVLALNSVDEGKRVTNLFGLGLSIESEARQVAALVQGDGARAPLVLVTDSPFSQRMRDAFAAEWQLRTGNPPQFQTFNSNREQSGKLKGQIAERKADAIFLATDTKKARLVRPYLGSNLPIYATSQIWGGHFGKSGGNGDLLGIQFVDMPWLLEPYGPEAAGYKRPDKPLVSDLQRFYALGIDAYRLTLQLIVSAPDAAIEMQGVTGLLRLSETRQFSRELMRSEIGRMPLTPGPEAPPAPVPAVTR